MPIDERRRWRWAGVVLLGALAGCDLLPGRGTDTAAAGRPPTSDTISVGATTSAGASAKSGRRASPSRRAARTAHPSRSAIARAPGSSRISPSSTDTARPGADSSPALALPAPPPVDPVLATMGGDLRRLVVAQKQHFANQGQYSDRLSALAIRYLPHAGVSVQIVAAGANGWAGRATYEGRPGRSCVIWIGAVPRPATDAQHRAPQTAGTPVCDSL